MSRIAVRKPTREDLEFISRNLRDADRQEYIAATGRSPEKTLASAVTKADEFYAGYLDDTPVAIFGRTESSPWLLMTTEFKGFAAAKFLVTEGRTILSQWYKDHGTLSHSTDARNVLHHRFILSLGCQMETVGPHGALKLPFITFTYNE